MHPKEPKPRKKKAKRGKAMKAVARKKLRVLTEEETCQLFEEVENMVGVVQSMRLYLYGVLLTMSNGRVLPDPVGVRGVSRMLRGASKLLRQMDAVGKVVDAKRKKKS